MPRPQLIYKSRTRSYRDLPLRYFELGTVYRHEKSGVLHGLLRVRGFTQDDAHIFCTAEQLKGEIKAIIDFVFEAMQVFGFQDVAINLSTRPKEFIGAEADWERATRALEDSLKEKGLAYAVSPGEGAFYGPKIDIQLKDALGRAWQCATIQCDFALPEKFDLTYVDNQGRERRPVMLHRVLLGSIERFLGALLEHYGGKLPLWLSPTQVAIIPIAERHIEAAKKLKQNLEARGLRAEIYAGKERMEKKIRRVELEKVPYAAIIGEREITEGKIAVRQRDKGDIGKFDVEEFIRRLQQEAENRR